MADLDPRAAVDRLERRGGRIRINARVRTSKAYFAGTKSAEYRFVRQDDGETGVAGPKDRHWILGTEAARAKLVGDIQARLDAANAAADGPAIEYVIVHVDELQADAGYGQVGCLLVVASTLVGWLIGLAVVWLQTGSVPAPMILVAPVVAFVGLMYTADWLGSFIVGLPGMRDRATNLITLVLAVAPGFITALLIVVAAIWKG